MISGRDNNVMISDLDAAGWGIRNCRFLHAQNLVETNDPRLSDRRPVLDGSVTNDSVWSPAPPPPPIPVPPPDAIAPPPEDDLRIVQSKLNLNGGIPANYLQSDTTQPSANYAARGDLYQPSSEKGVLNGYASLDSTKHIPGGQLPLGGSGTLKELFLTSPSELVFVPPLNPVTGQILFGGNWSTAPKFSLFGQPSGADDARPAFHSGKCPVAWIPPLAGSKLATGVLARSTLPVAIGVGPTHAIGAVPDPGVAGDPTDYLGRDMKWKAMTKSLAYQPTLPAPSVTVIKVSKDVDGVEVATVTITSSQSNVAILYRKPPMETFEVFTTPVTLYADETIEAYVVKVGYNASEITYYNHDFFAVEAEPPPPI